jgi:hypothetical protein
MMQHMWTHCLGTKCVHHKISLQGPEARGRVAFDSNGGSGGSSSHSGSSSAAAAEVAHTMWTPRMAYSSILYKHIELD